MLKRGIFVERKKEDSVKKPKLSVIIIFAVLTIPAFMLGCKIVYLYQVSPKGMDGYVYVLSNLAGSILSDPFTLNVSSTYLGGLVSSIALWLIWIALFAFPKNYRYGEEHGSARWGTASDIKPFMDNNPDNNIILTETEGLTMEEKMKVTPAQDFNRNKNVVVIGSPGSNKTRGVVIPNLMQMHSSYVASTTKTELFNKTGYLFKTAGYKLKLLNFVDLKQSHHYNFFKYISDDMDVHKIVDNIIKNTSPPGPTTADPFWEKSEIAFLEAIFSYLIYEAEPEDRSMETVMMMYQAAQVKEDDEDYISALDVLFDELKEMKPHCFAVEQYDIFKKGAGKTIKSILISVGVRLSPFNIPDVRELTRTDDLDLELLGDEKTILYVCMSDTDTSLNFLVAIMYQQLFDVLVRRADSLYGGELPIPVRCIQDEFANAGQIPDFDKIIAIIRSRRISVTIILQSISQIKKIYEKEWETIMANCDSFLFLGSNEFSTLEYVSKCIDQETIDLKNDSVSKSVYGGYSWSNQTAARSLITPGEVRTISRRYCILIISGIPAFKSRKYDITMHKNYKYLSDSDKHLFFNFNDISKSTEQLISERNKLIAEQTKVS